MREYYQRTKDKWKLRVKAYKQANPDKVYQWNKDHDERRPDLVQARQARNHKRHYHERKTKIRARALKYLYNLSLLEYDQRVIDQNGLCAICKLPPKARKVRSGGVANVLCVDHNHVTGKVRELLCADCNLLIGQLEKNRELVTYALQYLEKH